MSIQARSLKSKIVSSGRKIGLVVEKDGPADRALSRSTKAAATVVNGSEKQLKKIATGAKEELTKLRAKIHAATAPAPAPKKGKR